MEPDDEITEVPENSDLMGMTLEELDGIRSMLVMDNQQALRELAAEGGGIDPMSAFGMRFEMLLGLILTPEQRLQFDIAFERRVAAELDNARSQIMRAKLTAPLQQQNGHLGHGGLPRR